MNIWQASHLKPPPNKSHHKLNGKIGAEKKRFYELMCLCYRIKYSSCVLCMNGGHCYLSSYLRRSYVVYVLLFSSQTLERGRYKMHYPLMTETYKHILPLCLSSQSSPILPLLK